MHVICLVIEAELLPKPNELQHEISNNVVVRTAKPQISLRVDPKPNACHLFSYRSGTVTKAK